MQEHWASFWEHIEDLRHTLLRSFIVVGVGFVFLLMFYQPILHFLAAYPVEQTEEGLTKYKVQRIQIVNQTTSRQSFSLPPRAWPVSLLPLLEEKEERIYQLSPGERFVYEEAIESPLLIMGPIEGLVLVLKACFWLSLALTAPIWGWIWLQFILPGLKEQERAMLIPFLLLSLICLGLGIALAYSVTLPIANQYLLLFNSSIGQNAWTLMHYVDYVLLLCLGHAIAAELALLLFILVHFRVLSATWLIAKRRYMIVLAFVLGALLTPPDVLTQLLLAIPLIGLYQVAIYYAKWREPLASKFGTSPLNVPK
jgi:sec-independent protein translocase protein TatC